MEELKKEIEGLRKKVQEAEKIQDLSNMLQESHKYVRPAVWLQTRLHGKITRVSVAGHWWLPTSVC